MALKVYEVSLEMIEHVRPLMGRVANHDRAASRGAQPDNAGALADQLRRAASSVPLNIAEGSASHAGNKKARYRTAAGSAAEVGAALDVAVAWRFVTKEEAEPVREDLDRIGAMLWRLTH